MYSFPRLTLPPSLVARAVLLLDLNRTLFYSGGHYPPREGTSSAMYPNGVEQEKELKSESKIGQRHHKDVVVQGEG